MLGNGPAVVNWFQSTCVACQAELGTFAAVADKELTRIHFLGVDVNDPSPAAALAMVRRAGANYPVAEAPGIASISLATRFGVGDLPATVFVERSRHDPGRGAGQGSPRRARRTAHQPGSRAAAQLLKRPDDAEGRLEPPCLVLDLARLRLELAGRLLKLLQGLRLRLRLHRRFDGRSRGGCARSGSRGDLRAEQRTWAS